MKMMGYSKQRALKERTSRRWRVMARIVSMAVALLIVSGLAAYLLSRPMSLGWRQPAGMQNTTLNGTLNSTEHAQAVCSTADIQKMDKAIHQKFAHAKVISMPADDMCKATDTLVEIAHMTYKHSLLGLSTAKVDANGDTPLQVAVKKLAGAPQLVRDLSLGPYADRVKYGTDEYILMRVENGDVDAGVKLPAEHFVQMPLRFQDVVDGKKITWVAGKVQGEGLRLPSENSRHTPEQARQVVRSMLLALKDVGDQGYYYDGLSARDMRRVKDASGKDTYIALAQGFSKTADVAGTAQERLNAQVRGIRRYIDEYITAEMRSYQRAVLVTYSSAQGKKWFYAPVGSDELVHFMLRLSGMCAEPLKFKSIEEMLACPYMTGEQLTLTKEQMEGVKMQEMNLEE